MDDEDKIKELQEALSRDDSLLQTVLILTKHFGRHPSDREVYQVVWGTPEMRQAIWDNKGFPERKKSGTEVSNPE